MDEELGPMISSNNVGIYFFLPNCILSAVGWHS